MIPNLIIGGAAASKRRSGAGGITAIDYLGSVILTGTSGSHSASEDWPFGTVERDDLSAVDAASAPYTTITIPSGTNLIVFNWRPRDGSASDSYTDLRVILDGGIIARHINHTGYYAADGVGGAYPVSGGETLVAHFVSNSAPSSPLSDSRFSVDFYGE